MRIKSKCCRADVELEDGEGYTNKTYCTKCDGFWWGSQAEEVPDGEPCAGDVVLYRGEHYIVSASQINSAGLVVVLLREPCIKSPTKLVPAGDVRITLMTEP